MIHLVYRAFVRFLQAQRKIVLRMHFSGNIRKLIQHLLQTGVNTTATTSFTDIATGTKTVTGTDTDATSYNNTDTATVAICIDTYLLK